MSRKSASILLALFVVLILCFIVNISIGGVNIPFKSILQVFVGDHDVKSTWKYIILNYRLPKAFAAILVGVALSISGLLMQTLFRNPVAEPYILGVSSGASLGVAFLFLGASFLPSGLLAIFTSSYGVAFISILGSFLLLLLVLMVSAKVKNTVTILIVGLMFGSFTNAIISILSYFSNAEDLKRFSFWSMGSLGNLSYSVLGIFFAVVCIGFFSAFGLIRSLDAILLGDNYASSMGIPVKKLRNSIIIITALLAGASTAFVGPIAFIGLAVPHMGRLIFKTSSHKVLLLSCLLLGPVILLICDSLTQINSDRFSLPINAITSLFGAPIVVWLLLGKSSRRF
ncbi:iron chelate uptake ABC transporter family permease subunit [Myroides sp. LJL116]